MSIRANSSEPLLTMPMQAQAEKPTTVYYNSACPVCNTGIAAQKQCMSNADVQWIDIHNDPAVVQTLGASVNQVRERLYVRDAQGHIKIGAAALAELWLLTPGLRWLGRLLQWRWLAPLVERAYNAFARRLYRWNMRHGRW